MSAPPEVTDLLNRVRQNPSDREAQEAVYVLLMDEFHSFAVELARGEALLSATEMIGRVFDRLLRKTGPAWETRLQFYRYAAKALRHLRCDYARRRLKQRELEETVLQGKEQAPAAALERAEMVVAVDEALKQLAVRDPQAAELAELRFFGAAPLPHAEPDPGDEAARQLEPEPLSVRAAAEVLGLTRSAAYRAWNRAAAFLKGQSALAAWEERP